MSRKERIEKLNRDMEKFKPVMDSSLPDDAKNALCCLNLSMLFSDLLDEIDTLENKQAKTITFEDIKASFALTPRLSLAIKYILSSTASNDSVTDLLIASNALDCEINKLNKMSEVS